MQERVVDGVAGVLDHLQPVARHQDPKGHRLVVAWIAKSVQDGEFGHAPLGSHIGEQQAVQFTDWVAALPKALFNGARGGLCGCLQDGAINVELPSVVAALDTLVGRNAKLK